MNQLEIDLGLIELTPAEEVYKEPTAYMLKSVLKIKQTEEMLIYVCERDGKALKHAAKKLITPQLCEIAVNQNGLALEYVPDDIIKSKGKEWHIALCKKAVKSNGLALEYVPEELKDAEIVKTAIFNYELEDEEEYEWTTFPVAYAPKSLLSGELLLKAVEHTPLCIKDIPKNRITKRMATIAVEHNGLAIQYIPERFLNDEIIYLATSNTEMSLMYIPQEFLTQDICNKCFEKNPAVLGYLPVEYVSKEMCLKAIKQSLFSVSSLSEETMIELRGGVNTETVLFDDLPEMLRNDKDVLSEIVNLYKYGSYPLIKWNERVIESRKDEFEIIKDKRDIEIKPLCKKTVEYLLTKVVVPKEKQGVESRDGSVLKSLKLSVPEEAKLPLQTDSPGSSSIITNNDGTRITHDFSESDNVNQTFYYVSDIHIEHQLSSLMKDLENQATEDREQAIYDFVREKISEMVSGINCLDDVLLIGGDVADSVQLSKLFYRELYSQWEGGPIISVLGNHELWDGTSPKEWNNPIFQSRPIEEIVDDYKRTIQRRGVITEDILLENELYIQFKGDVSKIITGDIILKASNNDLEELLSKCTSIVLGGIGYSGLNPIYNSELGLYRKAITSLEEDRKRTAIFKKIYDKVMRCAKNRRVIVLTHTPVYNWTNDICNPNWIYVNGHTHQNSLTISVDGTTVLSDNQIGYKPSKWKLHSFIVDAQWYDPFERYKDGIYCITSEEYRDFNRGRGILSKGCSYEGKLQMIKRDNMYMFVLETDNSLCLMAGGQRRKLPNRNIQYYYDNLQKYCEGINKIIAPYKKVMKQLSEEVKRIGGSGIIHGCIVDITFFSHIYVNPFDGKITPYWALEFESRKGYANMQMLLEKEEPELLSNYLAASEMNTIPLIGKKNLNIQSKGELATIPKWIFGTKMYKASRVLKAIQYVWEQNVIRVWNDEVLQAGEADRPLLTE